MAYSLPQVLVFQEFTTIPAAVANPLRAHIAGGHAQLVRFGEADERNDGFLGYYDALVDADYTWPNRQAGGVVDQTYTQLWMKDALLHYFECTAGDASAVTRLAGFNNRVSSAALNFAENGDYARSDEFLDRDVAVGDVVRVRAINEDDDPITLWTYVKRVVGRVVDGVVGDASPDVNNKATQGASVAVTKVSGVNNGAVITPDGSAYDGLASGYINETYDLLVTNGSVNQDDTAATLRVISGSGTDDQASVTPAARGVPFAIGTRGLLITVSDDDLSASSTSAADAGIEADELIIGHRWRVTVGQDFTRPVAASGGTYDNDDSTIYVVRVSLGGTFAGTVKPKISVTTTNGVDISGPTTVSAADAAVAIGTGGTTIAFSGPGLRKDDFFYIPVTAPNEGPRGILELGSNLDPSIPAGTDCDLTLYIRKPTLEVTADRTGAPPLVNWEQSETQISVKAGITAFDASWTDDGVPVALDVASESSQSYGGVYVSYRAWLADLCATVNGISDPGDLNDAIPGPLHPDNPLKWAVSKALENSNGVEVKFTSVCDPSDTDSWVDLLNLLIGRDDVYNLVPLTRDRTVQDLYAGHVGDQSTAEQGLWRVAWFNLAGVATIPVVSAGSDVPNHLTATTRDGEVCLCVVEDDSDTSGTQYTVLRCTSGNADFLTNGVRPGDVVRLAYTGDGFGNYTWSEYVVDEVTSEDQVRLLSGPALGITVGAKTEVWRNLSAAEESAEIARTSGSWASRRIRSVWPDSIEAAGTVMEGYHACAALAGLASGVLPHQGLTRLELTGFSSVSRTTDKFNRAQLDAMAFAGTWIVTQDNVTGAVYTRHAVTTAAHDNINEREEMITRNVDSISYRFKDHFAPFIGVSNVTPQTIVRIGTEFKSLTSLLQTEAVTQSLGGQLISATLVELRRHTTLRDRVVLTYTIEVPYALNNLEIHLTV